MTKVRDRSGSAQAAAGVWRSSDGGQPQKLGGSNPGRAGTTAAVLQMQILSLRKCLENQRPVSDSRRRFGRAVKLRGSELSAPAVYQIDKVWASGKNLPVNVDRLVYSLQSHRMHFPER